VPMWIGAATTGQLTGEVDAFALVRGTLVAGFMEELLFRGFLFGLLFRKAGWGFVPAALLGGILFGMGHLYQGHSLGEALGVFLVTALGGGWFAWLYVEWNYNLWVPIWLHVCMNLVWMLFELGDNALGGWLPNLFRALTIALTIVVTLRWHATRGRRITRRNLWVNRDAA
ncbi:MAG: CPBP family intramembrane metalloprotease, partial [Bacteroidetes bacterium]